MSQFCLALLLSFLIIQCNCCFSSRLIWNTLNPDFPEHQRSFNDLDQDSSIPVSVSINVSKPLYMVDVRFLSVTLDPYLIREGWKSFNFNSVKLRNLAKGLSPLLFRCGGTDADFLIFNNTISSVNEISAEDTRNIQQKELRNNFTMSAMDWDDINKFAFDAGWDVLFDLNMLLRNGTEWDSTNAEELFTYTNEKGYRIAGWEMGSESNHISHHTNFTMDPGQLGKDFITLRRLLDQYGYQDSFLVGPDTTQPVFNKLGQKSIPFLESFLQTCGNSTTATTWHSYSFNGRLVTVDNYTDPAVMDVFKRQIAEVKSIIYKYRPYLSKSWIGETSGGWGGGTPDVSDAYAGGFIWLDKLGVGAAYGIDLIMRQAIFGGNYGLVTGKLNPRPAYWLSYIYKQLVGQVVLSLNVTVVKDASGAKPTDGSLPTYIRAYAHCTNKTSRFSSAYGSGYITLFLMNLNQSEELVFFLGGALHDKTVDQYLLTPHGGSNITSKEIDLNGKHLKLTSSDTIPAIEGQPLPQGKPITLPSLTYGFFVINANASACL